MLLAIAETCGIVATSEERRKLSTLRSYSYCIAIAIATVLYSYSYSASTSTSNV